MIGFEPTLDTDCPSLVMVFSVRSISRHGGDLVLRHPELYVTSEYWTPSITAQGTNSMVGEWLRLIFEAGVKALNEETNTGSVLDL